jgi:hypothetical protein
LLVTALVTTEARTFAGAGYTAASSPAAATPVASPAATPAAVTGNAYESPTFGWHLTWDDDVWSVEDEWSRGGTDRLRLGTGTSSVHFSAYRAHDGDAARCIEQPIAFRPTQPGTTDVTVVEGPTGDTARTWLVQTFVFTEEQGGRDWEIREYAECRSLVPGEAVLVIDFLAVADEYDDHFPLLEELLAGIVLPSQADRAETATVPVGWRDAADRGTSG